VIVGVLAAVAYPSYMSYLARGRRSSAQAFLMDIAQAEQRYLLDARSYADFSTLNVTTPSSVSPYYDISVVAPSTAVPPTFTATATPKAGTPQVSDVTLSIDSAGVKAPPNVW